METSIIITLIICGSVVLMSMFGYIYKLIQQAIAGRNQRLLTWIMERIESEEDDLH